MTTVIYHNLSYTKVIMNVPFFIITLVTYQGCYSCVISHYCLGYMLKVRQNTKEV